MLPAHSRRQAGYFGTGQASLLNSIVLTWLRCYFIYTSNSCEHQLHCLPITAKRQDKTEGQSECKKRGNFSSFFFEFRQNPHPRLTAWNSPGSCCSQNVTAGCLGRKLPPPVTVLWGMQGAWNQPSPSLPNLFSKPLLSKKRERERRNKKYTRPWKHFCQPVFQWSPDLTSSLPIRIAICNFAGISLMS